ncbi:hypothetical protein D3P07_21345 [Paenibacillus sp. 1011MAR3C5]|uniref:hypothetical protein n=1 Tax=Paenibacillus sp. 1011MAR3C5 TaxID=1675787 RepID=UPI000E6BA92A|nr:hypothetical protein [Paenibacillus sp. 1011MAR3C5]RJE85119.1 hypothetical protein D3P07_21345 [Paenibacillus sp. 1011MAR3C5]
MALQLEFPQNIILVIASILGWGIVIYWMIRNYQKLREKPVVWKMILVTLVGILSVSINVTLFSTTVKLSILPIGVLLVFLFMRNSSWNTYRKFAWIGFFSSFILVAATLLGSWLHQTVYDKTDPVTYLSDIQHIQVIGIHPSAQQIGWDKETFEKRIPDLKLEESYDTLTWYYESRPTGETMHANEKFPYALLGAKPSWGSGYESAVFVESDGKGLLIQTPERHYYFRSEEPLVNVEVTARED